MRKPVRRRSVAPLETISARPLKSSAARNVEPAGLPRISSLRTPSGITISRCSTSVPAGRSTVPVLCSRALARSASWGREQPAIHIKQSARNARTSDNLDSNGCESAPAEGQMELMRSRRNGIRQEQVDLIALLERVSAKDVDARYRRAVGGRLQTLRVGSLLHPHFDGAADDARAGQQVDAIGDRA